MHPHPHSKCQSVAKLATKTHQVEGACCQLPTLGILGPWGRLGILPLEEAWYAPPPQTRLVLSASTPTPPVLWAPTRMTIMSRCILQVRTPPTASSPAPVCLLLSFCICVERTTREALLLISFVHPELCLFLTSFASSKSCSLHPSWLALPLRSPKPNDSLSLRPESRCLLCGSNPPPDSRLRLDCPIHQPAFCRDRGEAVHQLGQRDYLAGCQ